MGSLTGLDKPVVCLDMPEAVSSPVLADYNGILLAEQGLCLDLIADLRLRPIGPCRRAAPDECQDIASLWQGRAILCCLHFRYGVRQTLRLDIPRGCTAWPCACAFPGIWMSDLPLLPASDSSRQRPSAWHETEGPFLKGAGADPITS